MSHTDEKSTGTQTAENATAAQTTTNPNPVSAKAPGKEAGFRRDKQWPGFGATSAATIWRR